MLVPCARNSHVHCLARPQALYEPSIQQSPDLKAKPAAQIYILMLGGASEHGKQDVVGGANVADVPACRAELQWHAEQSPWSPSAQTPLPC